MMKERILIVEDEDSIAELIAFNLKKNGYETFRVDSGERAFELLNDGEKFDLILLDLMLAGMDGLDFCKMLRQVKEYANIPVIMLTARSEESDVVSGLEFGANDYITKPFSPRILIARIRAQLRKATQAEDSTSQNSIEYAGIILNRDFHEVSIGKNQLTLTANEFSILDLFMSSPGRVFSRDAIIVALHGDGYPVTDRAIDVSIVNLRKKLADKASLIETVRGVGYKMKKLA